MNALVYAQLVQLHANAQLRVERLDAKHRETPNTIGKHTSRLSLFRQMKEAKDQAASWHYVMEAAMLSAEDNDSDDVDGVPE